jgi:hypothetical protein
VNDLAKQPEGKLSLKIIDAWKAMGAYAYKVHGNEYTPVGTPDICGVFQGWSIWCETKMPGNKPSMAQWKKIRDLRRAGALVIVSYTLTDAVQMLVHIESNEHARVDCGCLYSEDIDLLQKKRDKDYR